MVRENLKKIDLVKQLNNRTGLSKNLLKKIVDDLIYIIVENIKQIILILKILVHLKY